MVMLCMRRAGWYNKPTMSERVQTTRKEIYFGPQTLQKVPLVGLRELQQVRTAYDPAGIEELATSMVLEADLDKHPERITSEAFNLNNPIIVARLDEGAAWRYVDEHAKYYGIDDPQDVSPMLNQDGMLELVVGGHRRTRALHVIAKRCQIDPADILVAANVHENISFEEGMGLQLRENVYERPPVHDEARAIELFYRGVKQKNGMAPPIKEFAAQLGFSETKVRDALAFASLPAEIQKMTQDGLLSYTVARSMRPLQEKYWALSLHEHPDSDDEKRSAWVRDYLVTDAWSIIRSKLQSSDTKPYQFIENKMRALAERMEAQEALFELEVESPQRRRA